MPAQRWQGALAGPAKRSRSGAPAWGAHILVRTRSLVALAPRQARGSWRRRGGSGLRAERRQLSVWRGRPPWWCAGLFIGDARDLLARAAELPGRKRDLLAVLSKYRAALLALATECDQPDHPCTGS